MTSPPQPHQRRLKIITLTVDSTEISGQVKTCKFDPGFSVGDPQFTFATAGEGHNSYYEEVDPKPSLQLTFLDDWRDGGISDFLWTTTPLTVVDFTLEHHPDIAAERYTVAGSLIVVPHAIGGDVRTTEQSDQTFPVLAGYTYTHA